MKYTKRILGYAMIALPVSAVAQNAAPPVQGAPAGPPPNVKVFSLTDDKATTQVPQVEIGGIPCVDMINLGASGPGAPLRFGNVIARSEKVMLNGMELIPGKDYSIDYATGVVYLQRAQRQGDSLTVAYRYDPKGKPTQSAGLLGTTAMKFGMLPGAASMFMGLGVTERTADGKVIRSNIFGTQNNFSFKGGSLKGAYFMGERDQAQVQNSMNYDAKARAGEAEGVTGKSSFNVQSFGTKVGGASFFANIQDVSKNFAGFSAVRDAGFNDAEVNSFRAERGLLRQGFGMTGLNLGGMKFSADQSSVNDDKAGIQWQNFGLAQKGFSFNMNTQRVEQGFARFNDIREGNREQLNREQGIARSNMLGALEQKFGKLSFSSNAIEEMATGRGISRQETKLEAKNFSVVYGDQSVAKGFSRFGSLLGLEQGAYGLEAGVDRQWMAFNSKMLGAGSELNFSRSSMTSEGAGFIAQNIKAANKTWSLEHVGKESDGRFNRLGAMSQPEQDRHISEVSRMYGPGAQIRPEDRGAFVNGNGVGRQFTKASVDAAKGLKLGVERLELSGKADKGSMDTISIESKNFQASIRKTDIGMAFNEGMRLMSFERERLGTIPGLNRLDMQMNMQLDKNKRLQFNRTTVDVAGKGYEKQQFQYQDKKVQVAFNQRQVDAGFNGMSQLSDPERDLLTSITGFQQQDANIRWNVTKNLDLQFGMFQASNGMTREDRRQQDLALDWRVDKSMTVNYVKQSRNAADPQSTIMAQTNEKLLVSKTMGQTKVQILDEKREFDGRANTQQDARRQLVAVETQVGKNTSLRTEQSRTDFQDGSKEQVSANTVSTKIAKNVGVSVTDTSIDRTGENQDETKRDYGFWYDFGKGVRLSYGQQRNLLGTNNGIATSTLAFGQDANRINPNQTNTVRGTDINGTIIGFANGVNTWDNQIGRTQAFSSFNLQTNKPFNIAPLGLSKASLLINMDMASDNSNWLRENQLMGFNANVGSYQVGIDYRGQVDNQGNRAADRAIRFKTDPTGKERFSGAMSYKMRNLPNGDQFAIRDFRMTYKPYKGFELSNSIQTNPEQANPNVILGSLPLADRRNEWRLTYNGNPNYNVSGLWQEQLNDLTGAMSRTAGVNVSLFNRSGSPLNLFYGLEQSGGPVGDQTAHRWHIEFNQRPGPNQVLSLFFGNLSYEGARAIQNSLAANNWTARLNYQLRF